VSYLGGLLIYIKNQLKNWIIFKGFVLFKNHFDDVIQINGLWLSKRTFFKTLMSDDFLIKRLG